MHHCIYLCVVPFMSCKLLHFVFNIEALTGWELHTFALWSYRVHFLPVWYPIEFHLVERLRNSLISNSFYLEQNTVVVMNPNLQVNHQSLGLSVFSTDLTSYCVYGSRVSIVLNLQDTMNLEKAWRREICNYCHYRDSSNVYHCALPKPLIMLTRERWHSSPRN